MSKKYILVTGATGFVGRNLCQRLLKDGLHVRGTLLESKAPLFLAKGVEPVIIKPLGPDTPWKNSLTDIHTIIHLAARVHVMDDKALDPLTEFRKVNVEGTARLAREAANAGVKRFVFISSIKVNGEENSLPYTPDSHPSPTDPYGVSKWEAEQALRQIERETGLEVVVVRPTLVYGPGVKANFLIMMKAVKCGIPLPLASIKNKRSMIYVFNLVDALAICANHPSAAGQTYLLSDGEDVSTPELICNTASALGVSARLIPFPPSIMRVIGKLIGKSPAVNRLTGSLTVDSSKIRRDLGWKQPFTMHAGLEETAKWFKSL